MILLFRPELRNRAAPKRGKMEFMVIFAAHIVLGRSTAVPNKAVNDMEQQPIVWSHLIANDHHEVLAFERFHLSK